MSSLLVWGGAAVAAGLSARWNWWRLPVQGMPVLMYHKVGTPPADTKMPKLWVSTDMFRKQMGYLGKMGYHPVTFKDLYAHLDKKIALPSKPVFITFDDGYMNNYEEAFPVLRDFGFKATLFVVVNTVGGDNKWHNPESESRIPMISWDHLRDLQRAGWEIGSHTLNHPRLPKLSPADVQKEMVESRKILTEQLNETPQTFAYPYGAGEDDPAIRNAAKEAGYRIAVGVHAGKWDLTGFLESPFNLPRVFVRGGENMFDFHLQLTRGQSRF